MTESSRSLLYYSYAVGDRIEAVGPDRLRPTFRPSEIRSFEKRIPKIAATPAPRVARDTKVDVSQVRVTQIRIPQVTSRDPRPSQRGAAKVSPPKLRPEEMGVAESCKAKRRTAEDVPDEGLVSQVSARQIRSPVIVARQGDKGRRNVRPDASERATHGDERYGVAAGSSSVPWSAPVRSPGCTTSWRTP